MCICIYVYVHDKLSIEQKLVQKHSKNSFKYIYLLINVIYFMNRVPNNILEVWVPRIGISNGNKLTFDKLSGVKRITFYSMLPENNCMLYILTDVFYAQIFYKFIQKIVGSHMSCTLYNKSDFIEVHTINISVNRIIDSLLNNSMLNNLHNCTFIC